MEARIVRLAPGRYRVEVRGEDHTLGNLIVKKLMEAGLARFAYYEVPHPLEDRLIIYLNIGEDDDPREALDKAAALALEELESLKKDLGKALRGS